MLSDLATVKAVLGITNTSRDAQISAILPGADSKIKQFIGLNLEQQSYTEYQTGQQTRFITLRQVPVYSITNLWLDDRGLYGQSPGAFDDWSLLVNGVDYELKLDNDYEISYSGVVVRNYYCWPMITRTHVVGKLTLDLGPTFGNIKIEYVGGYASEDMPAQFGLALAMYCAYLLRTTAYGGFVTEEALGRWHMKTAAPMVFQNGVSLPSDVAALLPAREIFF